MLCVFVAKVMSLLLTPFSGKTGKVCMCVRVRACRKREIKREIKHFTDSSGKMLKSWRVSLQEKKTQEL